MSSPSRYQSSVFNFLNRRSLQLSEQVRRTVRSVKMTAAWGAQILLYPVYVTFQTGRVAVQQFRQAVQTTSLRLKAVEKAIQKVKQVNTPPRPESQLSSDTPIYKVLQTIEAFALLPTVKTPLELIASPDLAIQPVGQSELTVQAPQVNELVVHAATENGAVSVSGAVRGSIAANGSGVANGSVAANGNGAVSVNNAERSLSLGSKIIGIASLITSRSLVLITDQGQTLDILTAEQQLQLRRRMVWELAHYWRTRRALWAQQQPTPFPLPLPEVRQNALPPVRLFRQLMAWMQTSSIAIATNLFQESVLVARLQAEQVAIAYQKEFTRDHPWTEDVDLWTDDDDSRTCVKPTFPDEATRFEPPQPALNSSATAPVNLLKGFRIRAMLPFSGKRQAAQQRVAQQGQSDMAIAPTMNGRLMAKPGMARPEVVNRTAVETAVEAAIAPSSDPSLQTNLVLPTPEAVGQMTSTVEAQNGSSELQTTWIETEATLVEYVKHPLEQALEWLDSSMLWIEEALIKAWNWIQHRWRT